MIIPESFMLFGHVINIKVVADLVYSRGSYGQANFDNNPEIKYVPGPSAANNYNRATSTGAR